MNIQQLIRDLRDSDPSVSFWAAEGLGDIGPAAVPALTEALKDTDDGVRCWAAWALNQIGGSER